MNTTPTIWATRSGKGWGTSTAGVEIYTASTSKWTEQDWEEFELTRDDDKWRTLHYLCGKHGETVSTLNA